MDHSLSPGDVVADKLRVVRKIGEGGMGAVYEVEHIFTKHRRALKMLHGQFALNPDAVERFLREASAAGRIGSPHIVETFDAGRTASGEPYLVMELLDGESLGDRLERKGRLALSEALEIAVQAAEGVQAAHEAGIVHRDLKPDNLHLTTARPRFLKILDFGISKFDAERFGTREVTRDGALLGTPYYMAPEQVRGGTADTASDVYALGVVLYECLTGQKPFVAETLPELCVLIHEGKYAPLKELCPDLPPRVGELLARAMHPDREQRPRDASALRQALLSLRDALAVGEERTVAAPSAPPPSGIGGTLLLQSTSATARTASPDPKAASLGGLSRSGVSEDATASSGRPRRVWLVVAAASVIVAGAAAFALSRPDVGGGTPHSEASPENPDLVSSAPDQPERRRAPPHHQPRRLSVSSRACVVCSRCVDDRLGSVWQTPASEHVGRLCCVRQGGRSGQRTNRADELEHG